MVRQSHPRSGSFSTRLLGSLAGVAGVIVVMFLLLDRPDAPPPPVNAPTGPVVTQEQRRSEDELIRILDGVRPGRLGLSSERSILTGELNTWRQQYVVTNESARLTSDQSTIDKLLTGETLTRVNSDRFLPEDISYLRECLLARSILEQVSARARTDADRIVGVFDFVTMAAAFLTEEQATGMAVTPYESLLFGVGTGADRAWTVAMVLRQLGLDAIILIPGKPERQEHWLLGVIDPRRGVLLFDPRLGLPIPAESQETSTPYPSPATLAEVLKSDAPFRQLDMEGSPYPLASDDFRNVKVQLIGTSSMWAPRMAELQFYLPTSISLDVYAGLGENKFRTTGIYQRVIEAGQSGLWTADQISVWQHPEAEIVEIEAARGAEGTRLAELFYVFGGPYNVSRIDPKTGTEVIGRPDYTLHAVRVEQLMGNQALALRHYLDIRRAAGPTAPQVNHVAAEYASLWTGVAQYETRRFPAALSTFRLYIDRHPQLPPWGRIAFDWGARSLLANHQAVEAAQLLKTAPGFATSRRDTYLVRRWQGLNAEPTAIAPQTTPAASPVTSSTEPGEAPAAPASTPEPAPAPTTTPTDSQEAAP